MRWEERDVRWFCRFERVLFRLVIVGAVTLALAQAVVGQSSNRSSPEPAGPNEAVATFGKNDPDKEFTMTLELLDISSLSKAKVLINGSTVNDFSERFVTVNVSPGDAVEIDGSFYERPFRVKLTDIYPDVVKPEKGIIHNVRQERHLVGKIEPD